MAVSFALPWSQDGNLKVPLSYLISLILLLFHSEAACGPTQRRPYKMQTFRIWDVNQKVFYLSNNQLVAGYLQAANAKLEEKMNVELTESRGGMFLGIHEGKLWLACVKSGDKITLQLEVRTCFRYWTTIKTQQNGPTTSFESAAYPGWFLCTESEGDGPVSLTNKPGNATKVTQFYFHVEQ
ncbi:LOW QUALITY PROTEIN: interleukin-1 receptor antagonist protein [Trichechus manatus latirostris]|uniref:Interleukin-1 receptor antagonist protein n=1 Tax=Trichechus manatus latirostris TaxID=127582 RepID=A0A2Y9RVF8_TRIMA|nr:LOW QUALITY PROTEIN: interleukin-1 receptor antagonist protein [Trichechus manatus latirostris]